MISKNQIKFLNCLSLKKNRQKYQQVVLEGQRLIEESIKAGAELEYICLTENNKNRVLDNKLFKNKHT